tara:strand:+ start:200 stop:385 length:186 start_codon:yes stop_codon:yes gene_type:complete
MFILRLLAFIFHASPLSETNNNSLLSEINLKLIFMRLHQEFSFATIIVSKFFLGDIADGLR